MSDEDKVEHGNHGVRKNVMSKSIEERIPSPQDVLWGEDEQALLDLCVEALNAAKSQRVFVPFNEREFSLATIDEVIEKLKWSKTHRVFVRSWTANRGPWEGYVTDPAGWELDKQILRGESTPKDGITLVPCSPRGKVFGSGSTLTERRIHLDVLRGKVKLSDGQVQGRAYCYRVNGEWAVYPGGVG